MHNSNYSGLEIIFLLKRLLQGSEGFDGFDKLSLTFTFFDGLSRHILAGFDGFDKLSLTFIYFNGLTSTASTSSA